MRSFLICPVRGSDGSDSRPHYERLKTEGWDIYWPHIHTDQNDPTGLRICRDNLLAIKRSGPVHIVWDGKSQGSLFDLGMAFALGKQIIPLELPDPTEGKSFQNMINEWARLGSQKPTKARKRQV